MIYREAVDCREKGAGQNKTEAVWPAGKEEHMAEIDLGLVVGPPGEPGTTDYQALENKPRINGTVLEGDIAPGDLGLVMAQEGYLITTIQTLKKQSLPGSQMMQISMCIRKAIRRL